MKSPPFSPFKTTTSTNSTTTTTTTTTSPYDFDFKKQGQLMGCYLTGILRRMLIGDSKSRAPIKEDQIKDEKKSSRSHCLLASLMDISATTSIITNSVCLDEAETFFREENEGFWVLTFIPGEQQENESKNSSPDSVLDIPFDFKEEYKKQPRERTSRRRLYDKNNFNYKEINNEVRKDEEEMEFESSVIWIEKNGWRSEQVEEIAVKIGLEILAVLLFEVIQDLCFI